MAEFKAKDVFSKELKEYVKDVINAAYIASGIACPEKLNGKARDKWINNSARVMVERELQQLLSEGLNEMMTTAMEEVMSSEEDD